MKRILSEDAFRAALEEECACIARGGYPACVGVFDIGERGPRGADAHRLGAALGGALRQIDVVGWTGDKQITLLLPGTSFHAAHRVAARLAREVLPCVAEPSVSPLRSAPVIAVPRHVGHPARARRARGRARRARPVRSRRCDRPARVTAAALEAGARHRDRGRGVGAALAAAARHRIRDQGDLAPAT